MPSARPALTRRIPPQQLTDRSYHRSRAAARPSSLEVSELGGRRAAGRSNRQQNAVGDQLERDGATGIGEMPGVETCRRVWIRPELARSARRAVLRGFEMAEEIVMLEWHRDEKDKVEGHPNVRPGPPAAISQSAKHLYDDTPLNRLRTTHRPTMTLKRAAMPPRSRSPASFERPPSPKTPGTWVY